MVLRDIRPGWINAAECRAVSSVGLGRLLAVTPEEYPVGSWNPCTVTPITWACATQRFKALL